ncbi:MAG: hypothetical protein A2Z96_00650 [Spirochaetes bacterium GWB1_48_6]|nr:MAG: hypothetical protein A2Z96_00650 [Spirochaetes bacterium GWB1_48_6]
MLQVYFLLVAANILAGLSLAGDYLKEKFPSAVLFLDLLQGNSFRGALGVSTFLIGFFGLFAVLKEDNIPILADLLPAFSALIQGTGLVLEFYQRKSTVQAGLVDQLDAVILKNKNIIGVLGIFLGLLHFFFPLVIFL